MKQAVSNVYPDGGVDRLTCGNCKFFGHGGPSHAPCRRRIDHVTVRYAVPWFKSYDCNQHSGVVCSEFEPAAWCVFLAKTWRGFDYYWPRFVEQWGAPRSIPFILHGNAKVRYHVRTEDFVFGRMFVEGKLNAYERTFYVRDAKSPVGYRLITEPWNPLAVAQTDGERIRERILSLKKEMVSV